MKTKRRNAGFILLSELIFIAAVTLGPLVVAVIVDGKPVDPSNPIPIGTVKW